MIVRVFKISVILICFVTQTSVAQQVPDQRLRNIDSFVNMVMKTWNMPGVSIAIVEKNRVLYTGGFGYRNVEKKLPVTENTLFPIGSCTKAFTCALVGILENAGILKLDTPVKNYLPALNFYDAYTTSHITLRDLMCHRSGIPRHNLAWYTSPASRNELLNRIQFLQSSELRANYQYSNFNYLVIGAVIEKVTGKSWEENIRELILEKTEMNTTTPVLRRMIKTTDYALAYISNRDSGAKAIPFYSNIETMGAAGALNSSAKDMCNWLIAWTNAGKYNGNQIFPSGYLRQAITQQIPSGNGLPGAGNPDIYFVGYGLGWNLSSYKGHYRADHDGVIDGFVSNTSFFPSDSIGIFVVGNQDMPVYTIRNFISDCLLKLPPKDWNQHYLESLKKIKRPSTIDNVIKVVENPEKYTGTYYNKGYGHIEITLKNNNPEIILNGIVIRLVAEQKNIFKGFLRYPYSSSEILMTVLFITDKEGRKVKQVSIPLEPSVNPIAFDKIGSSN